MTLTDQSTGIREGEELDAAQIDPYLKAHIPGLTGTPRITVITGQPVQDWPAKGVQPQGEAIQLSSMVRRRLRSTMVKSAS